jgi:branched-chain amino acid transport system permease protein
VTWVNVILQGVLLGGFYALLACGLSLMFGVMRIINLAHGDIAVVGAYLVWYLATQLSISPFLAALLVIPGMWVVGYAMYVLLLERSRRAGLLVPLLTTFGLAIVIENVLLQVFSPDVHSLLSSTGSLATASVSVGGGLSISALGTLIFVTAVVVLTGSCSCRAPTQAVRCGPPPKIPTQPSSSASTRGPSTRVPPRLRSRPPHLAACSSPSAPRSIHRRDRRS